VIGAPSGSEERVRIAESAQKVLRENKSCAFYNESLRSISQSKAEDKKKLIRVKSIYNILYLLDRYELIIDYLTYGYIRSKLIKLNLYKDPKLIPSLDNLLKYNLGLILEYSIIRCMKYFPYYSRVLNKSVVKRDRLLECPSNRARILASLEVIITHFNRGILFNKITYERLTYKKRLTPYSTLIEFIYLSELIRYSTPNSNHENKQLKLN
jgi:hypothetical protein